MSTRVECKRSVQPWWGPANAPSAVMRPLNMGDVRCRRMSSVGHSGQAEAQLSPGTGSRSAGPALALGT